LSVDHTVPVEKKTPVEARSGSDDSLYIAFSVHRVAVTYGFAKSSCSTCSEIAWIKTIWDSWMRPVSLDGTLIR